MTEKKYNIKGRVVEVSKTKNYYKIIGDLNAPEGYTQKPVPSSTYTHCFQLNIENGKPNHIKLGDLVSINNAQLSIRDVQGKDLAPEDHTDMVVSIQKHNGIEVNVGKNSMDDIKAYLNRPYKSPAWKGIQNTVYLEGLVVEKFLSSGIIRLMTQNNTIHAKPSFVCFDVHISQDVYNFHLNELENIEAGDMLKVKGSIFYINNSFKHSDYTHDYHKKKKVGKKVILNVQANQLMKTLPGHPKAAERCIKEYLSDKFRIGNYGDSHSIKWAKKY